MQLLTAMSWPDRGLVHDHGQGITADGLLLHIYRDKKIIYHYLLVCWLLMLPLSFEFFPPNTAALHRQLDRAAHKLRAFSPQSVSCTFGAGGSNGTQTWQTVQHLHQFHQFDAAPHVACQGLDPQRVLSLLSDYQAMGCRRLVALRGDAPPSPSSPRPLPYAADLVSLIRGQFGSAFHISVAAYPETHPQASSAHSDLLHFKAKVDAGADAAITQYFYNADAYFAFVERTSALGITIPIIPGIMPITNAVQLQQFSATCGAEIPRWILRQLQAYGDDQASIRAFGLDVVTALCARLMAEGAPGLHFFTLNLAKPSQHILHQLGYSARREPSAILGGAPAPAAMAPCD